MIPVIFIWHDGKLKDSVRKHAILPALPAVGDLVVPPGEEKPMNVRAKEWDCSMGNGSSAVIHIALDSR